MKKYILLALTLGLNGTSYGASYGGEDNKYIPNHPAHAALLASSHYNQYDGLFPVYLTQAFTDVGTPHRDTLAIWTQPIFAQNWPNNPVSVIKRLDIWFKKLGFYASQLDHTQLETQAKLQFILMHGGSSIENLYDALHPKADSPANPNVIYTLYSHIRRQEALEVPMRVRSALAYLKAHPEILEPGYKDPDLDWSPGPMPYSAASSTASAPKDDALHTYGVAASAPSNGVTELSEEDQIERALALSLNQNEAAEDPDTQRALKVSAFIAEELEAAAALDAGRFIPTHMPADWAK